MTIAMVMTMIPILEKTILSKVVSKPLGQWNTMEIQEANQSYIVMINGRQATEFTGSRRNKVVSHKKQLMKYYQRKVNLRSAIYRKKREYRSL